MSASQSPTMLARRLAEETQKAEAQNVEEAEKAQKLETEKKLETEREKEKSKEVKDEQQASVQTVQTAQTPEVSKVTETAKVVPPVSDSRDSWLNPLGYRPVRWLFYTDAPAATLTVNTAAQTVEAPSRLSPTKKSG